MIHGHGNDLAYYNTPIEVDFSSNIWHEGMDAKMQLFLSEKIAQLANYPEPDAATLTQLIAQHHGVNADQVLAFNGSTDAFYTIAQAFGGYDSTILYPSFAEYYDACVVNKHKISYLSNNDNLLSVSFENQLIWMANPNNPDGKVLDLSEIEHLLLQNLSSIFIIDEAYIDLHYGAETAIPLLRVYSNLIVVRSLTKAFAVPGIRLGYIVTSNVLVGKIVPFLKPWSVNSLAIEVGKYIITNYNDLLPQKEKMLSETLAFQWAVTQIRQFTVVPSLCNYFLVQTHHKTASDLKRYLLHNHQMLIRDASNFKGLSPSYFRLATRGTHYNNKFVLAINQWINLQ